MFNNGFKTMDFQQHATQKLNHGTEDLFSEFFMVVLI